MWSRNGKETHYNEDILNILRKLFDYFFFVFKKVSLFATYIELWIYMQIYMQMKLISVPCGPKI